MMKKLCLIMLLPIMAACNNEAKVKECKAIHPTVMATKHMLWKARMDGKPMMVYWVTKPITTAPKRNQINVFDIYQKHKTAECGDFNHYVKTAKMKTLLDWDLTGHISMTDWTDFYYPENIAPKDYDAVSMFELKPKNKK